MARPLLIALLTVTAVAWPAAALGPVPTVADPATAVDAPVLDPLDPFLSSMQKRAAARCDPIEVSQDGPLPVYPQLDPDGCLAQLVDYVVDFVWPDPPIVIANLIDFSGRQSSAEADSSSPGPSDTSDA